MGLQGWSRPHGWSDHCLGKLSGVLRRRKSTKFGQQHVKWVTPRGCPKGPAVETQDVSRHSLTYFQAFPDILGSDTGICSNMIYIGLVMMPVLYKPCDCFSDAFFQCYTGSPAGQLQDLRIVTPKTLHFAFGWT